MQLRRDRGPLGELAAARRRRRLDELDVLDAIYGAYLTAIVVIVATVVGTTFVPDEQVAAATAARVAATGPAWLGAALALVVAVGCRSGGHGGPLALEAPVVQHVLLAPVDRRVALRGPAWRQLRSAAAVGAAAGGVGGLLAARRLPGTVPAFIASGAGTGALVAVLGVGAALALSGRRSSPRLATGVAAAVLALSALDVVAGTRASPLTHLGALALWPLDAAPEVVVGMAVVAAVVGAGLVGVGGTSLEAAERRAGLVGQLRFAVTLQDVRTVVLLRRQLAQEHARARPWVRLGSPWPARFAVPWRGARGIVRFPAVRLGRMAALGVVAGLAMRGVWAGTTPLVVVAAVALFVAGLDAIEPLSQEVDRPDRWAAFPRSDGTTLLQHLVAPAIAMGLVGLVAVGAAAVAGPSALALRLGLVVLPAAAVAAVAAAAGSVIMGPPDVMLRVMLPEAAGASMVFRVVWPPALVALALGPVIGARVTTTVAPVVAAANLEVLVVVVVGGVLGWLSTRRARTL